MAPPEGGRAAPGTEIWLGSAIAQQSGVWSAGASDRRARSSPSGSAGAWNADLIKHWRAAKSIQAFARRKVHGSRTISGVLQEVSQLLAQPAAPPTLEHQADGRESERAAEQSQRLTRLHAREQILANSQFGELCLGSAFESRRSAASTIGRFAKCYLSRRAVQLSSLTVEDLVGPHLRVNSLGPIFSASGSKASRLACLFSDQFQAETPPPSQAPEPILCTGSWDSSNSKPEELVTGQSLDMLSASGTERHGAAWEDLFCSVVGEQFVNDLKQHLRVEVAAPDSRDERRNTALHFAAWQGNLPACRWLVSQGADVHAENLDGRTPLNLATLGKREPCIEFLDLAASSPTQRLDLGSSIMSTLLCPTHTSRCSDISATLHSERTTSGTASEDESLSPDHHSLNLLLSTLLAERRGAGTAVWASALVNPSSSFTFSDKLSPGPLLDGHMSGIGSGAAQDSLAQLELPSERALTLDTKQEHGNKNEIPKQLVDQEFSSAMRAFSAAMQRGSACDTAESSRTSSAVPIEPLEEPVPDAPWSPSMEWAESVSRYEGVYTRNLIAELSFLTSPHTPATPDEFGMGATPRSISPLDRNSAWRTPTRSPLSSPALPPAMASLRDYVVLPAGTAAMEALEALPEQDEMSRTSSRLDRREGHSDNSILSDSVVSDSCELSPGTLVRQRVAQASSASLYSPFDGPEPGQRVAGPIPVKVLSQGSVDGFLRRDGCAHSYAAF